MPRIVLFPAIFYCLLLVLLSSCTAAGSNGKALPAQLASAGADSLSGSVPSPLELARQAADSFGFIQGEQTTAYLPQDNYVESDRSLRFSPAAGELTGFDGLAYASWYIPLTDSGALVWQGQWHTPPAADNLWLGLGNLEMDRWDWFAVSDPQAALSLPDSSPYQKEDGSLYLALVLMPGSGEAELDYFSLEAQSDSGWLYHRLDSHLLADTESAAGYHAEPMLLDGKPAIYYYWPTNEAGTESRAALQQSSTAIGAAASDWSTTELAANWTISGSLPLALGGDLTIFTSTSISEEQSELRYYHASDPAGSFSEELVATTDSPIGAFSPGVVGGLPAVSYATFIPEQTVSLYQIRYASSSAVSAGNWDQQSPNPDAVVSGAVSDVLSAPLDYNGLPMLIYRNVVNNIPQGVYVSYIEPDNPLDKDWGHLLLGEGSDNQYFSFMLDGRPCFASYNYVVFPPDEVKFWTYHFTGENPGELSDWTISLYDGLGLGGSGVGNIMSSGAELVFSHSRSGTSPYFNASAHPFDIWRSASPADDPLTWQSERVLADRESSSFCRLISVGGRLGMSCLQRTFFGSGDEERTAYELVWAVQAE